MEDLDLIGVDYLWQVIRVLLLKEKQKIFHERGMDIFWNNSFLTSHVHL